MPYIHVMKEIAKKKQYSGTSLCFIVLFSIFIISCKGQDEDNTSFQNNTEPNTSSQVFMDPLSAMDTNAIYNQTGLPMYYDGQLSHWVRNIFEDSRGNLWFGTNHYGVIRYDGDTINYISETHGIGGGRINEIAEDKDGNVWFCTYGGLSKYDGESFSNYPVKVGDNNNDLFALVIDRNDKFWISTINGVVQFDGDNAFTPFEIRRAKVEDPDPVLSPKRVTAIMEDSKGYMWFGTDGFGVSIYNPSAKEGEDPFTLITTENGLPDNRVSQIMEDSKGNIWIATMFGGISLYDGESFTNFTKDGEVEGVEAGGFYEDKDGDIWFAVENHGIYRFDGKSFVNFHEEEGLMSGGVLSMLEDKEGRFWIGGWKGLFRYDKSAEKEGKESFVPVTRNGPWEK